MNTQPKDEDWKGEHLIKVYRQPKNGDTYEGEECHDKNCTVVLGYGNTSGYCQRHRR